MRVSFCLLDLDYKEIDGKTAVILYGKTKDGRSVVVIDYSYRPYFYVLPLNVEKAKREVETLLKKQNFKIEKIETEKKKFFGVEKKFLKIFCFRPADSHKARDIIKVLEAKRGGSGNIIDEFEYSVGFYRHYLVDKKFGCLDWLEAEGETVRANFDATLVLKSKKIKKIYSDALPKLKVLAFDIEVVEEMGKQKVVMISLFGENYKKVLTYKHAKYPTYVKVVADEKELLKEFTKEVKEYDADLLVGYNSDLYDFEVLARRSGELKIELSVSRDRTPVRFSRRARVSTARLKGRVHLDLFNFISNILATFLQTEVLSLDAVSAELLGDEKIEMEYEEMLEAWKRSRALNKFAEYCLKDSELAYKLANLLLPQIFELTRLVGQSLFDVSRMSYSQLVEWYYIKKAKEINMVIPNQPKFEEIQKRRRVTYTGGYVKEPEPGLHENLAVIDFASLYPSISATYNVSIQTLNCKCCKGDGYKVPGLPYWFCKKHEGFESRAIKELLIKRQELKEKLKSLKRGSVEYNTLDARQKSLKTVANSLHPDEFVILMTPHGRIEIEKIGKFTDRFIKFKDVDGYEYGIPAGFRALCFDGFHLCFKKIKRCIRHKCRSKVYELTLDSGRKVRVTEDHSVFTLAKGKVVPVAISELRVGDRIVVPRKLSCEVKVVKRVNLLMELSKLNSQLTEDLVIEVPCKEKELAYNPRRGVRLIPFNKLEEVCEHVSNISEWRIGPINGARIPASIRVTPELMRFLGYYVSEGCSKIVRNKKGEKGYEVSIFSKNKEILRDVFKFMKSLGLNPVLRRDRTKTNDKMAYLLVSIFDCGEAANERRIPWIVFLSLDKMKEAFLKAYFLSDGHILKGRTTLLTSLSEQLINGLSLLLHQLGIGDVKLSCERNRYRVKVSESHSIAKLKIEKIPFTEKLLCCKKFEYVKECNMNWEEFDKLARHGIRGSSQELRSTFKPRYGDLILDRIVKKKLVEPPEYVYDFSVEKTENFVGGLGLICLHNSSYGYYAFPPSKWYSKECAESITAFGRYWIKRILEFAEKESFRPIYGDTDSLFLKVGCKSKQDLLKFLERVNERLPGLMRLDLEDFYVRGIFIPRGVAPGTAKKRYALLDEGGNLKIRGLEKVRRDWSEIAKQTQEQVLKLILGKKDINGAVRYVRKTVQKLKKLKVSMRDLVIYEQITKPLDEYKQISPHLIAAKKLVKHGIPVIPGSIIGFVITKGKGSISQRAEPVEYVELKDVDVSYYINNQVLPAALRILKVLGVDEKQLLATSGLESFLSR